MSAKRIAFIGFGEVGQTLAADLLGGNERAIAAFDVAFAQPASAQRLAASALGVTIASSAAEAVANADLVICAVTAGAAVEAARGLAPALGDGVIFMDVNSIAPNSRRAAAVALAEGRGLYLEAAVMAPIAPKRIKTPILLGGPHAAETVAALNALGFAARVFSDEIGAASSVKMCRSIMVKGLEALALECVLTADHYGVTGEVLASLKDTLPHDDWSRLAGYLISRALKHGKRRSEEMQEVARTVQDAGIAPLLSRAIVERQAWAGMKGNAMPENVLAGADLATLIAAMER